MRKRILFVLVGIFFNVSSALSDVSLSGTYINEKVEKAGGVGKLLIYPTGSDSYLFSLKLNRGAPSYNSGHLLGEILVKESTSIYENNEYTFRGKGCKWKITFEQGVATIETIDFSNKCGMGNNVYADGSYVIKSTEVPLTYINTLGDTVEFKKQE